MLIYNGICSEEKNPKQSTQRQLFFISIRVVFERKDTDIFFILFLLLLWHIYFYI